MAQKLLNLLNHHDTLFYCTSIRFNYINIFNVYKLFVIGRCFISLFTIIETQSGHWMIMWNHCFQNISVGELFIGLYGQNVILWGVHVVNICIQ